MPHADEQSSTDGKKLRKKRSRSSSPRRGSSCYESTDQGVRIDVYLAVTLFAIAVVFIKILPKY